MNPEQQAEIETLERSIREQQQALNALLRESTDHQPLANYVFGTTEGDVELSQLFGDHDELIIVHNMGSSCAYCTLWADGFNGMLAHFEDRAAFVVVSPNSPAAQKEFAESRGWKFRMVSDSDKGFTRDMGYAYEADGRSMVSPGFSTFKRNTDGTIQRVAHAPFGPGDVFCSVWPMFELLEQGSSNWRPKFSYDA